MSKPRSGLFHGTSGSITSLSPIGDPITLIQKRAESLDLREHPRSSSLSKKQRKAIKEKISTRTASKEEYRKYCSDKRFSERRKAGVYEFWSQEQLRVISGQQTTRDWSPTQRNAIALGFRPKFNGKTVQAHHTYSASRYPHLANKGEIIFPVTFDEHLYGWHGGNFKNSLPGKPIKKKQYYSFSGGKK